MDQFWLLEAGWLQGYGLAWYTRVRHYPEQRDRRGNQFASRLASCLVQRHLDITEANCQLLSAGLDDIQSS